MITRRIILPLLVATILFGFLAFGGSTAMADTDTETGLNYTITDGKATITGFTAPENFNGDLTIPATLGGATVVGIGDSAFFQNTSLTGVTIPDGVTSIGASAFFKCTNMASVTIPDSITSIGPSAFRDCWALADLTIPKGITNIDIWVFAGLPITSLTIPHGVQSIGDNSFSWCGNLKTVIIPASVTSIHNDAFYNSPIKTIYGFSGSEAQTYAVSKGITFVSMDAVINPSTASFNKIPGPQENVTATIIWNSAGSLTDVKCGEVSIGADNYVCSEKDQGTSTLTIKKEYLAAQAIGDLDLTIVFDKGAAATLTIAISDMTPYGIAIATVGGGTATVTTNPANETVAGATVTVNIAGIEAGKRFKSIAVTDADSGTVITNEVTAGASYTFTMPAQGVTVTVEVEPIPVYKIAVADVAGGMATVTTNPATEATAGTTITVNISGIETGKQFKSITVTDAGSGAVATTKLIVGESYTFTMPAKNVTVTVEVEPEVQIFDGGNGTEANPYQVATAEQLNNVRYHLGKHFKQTANIDLNVAPYNTGAGWEPIGSDGLPFTGTFDGDGKTISNLTINRSTENYVGLFGVIGATAKIQNVKLENNKVNGQERTGALVGKNQGTITNSYATGTVTGFRYLGGLVGYNYGSITDSYATGDVTSTSPVGSQVGQVGGLVGYNDGSITGSYATGAVTGEVTIGGLVGYNDGPITDSYATGAVTGSSYVGGLVSFNDGRNDGSITNSYATGRVTGSPDAGGLVEYNYQNGTVTNSYWDKDKSGMNSSAGGEGKTTAEMKQQATFAGWDFTNIWNIDGSRNDGYPFLKNNPSDYTVTISSSGNGDVTGGGIYKQGESVTLGAVPSEGYNFAGWYKGAVKVSSLPNYTFTVSEDVTLTASFTAMPKDDLTVVTVGDGVVKLNDEPTGLASDYKAQHTRGISIRLTATANSGNTFAYWQDSRSESILSTNLVYEFVMGAGTSLKAVFNRTPNENTDLFTVIFKDKSGRILQSTNVTKNSSINPPPTPTLVGYSFVGWDKSLDNVISDMTINALYERLSTTYLVTVVNGTLSTGGTEGSFKYDMPVTVVADTAPSGQKFRHWTQDGVKISTSSTFSFFAPMKDTTLEAMFVPEETVIVPVPFITLSEAVQVDTVNKTMLFTANRTVPAGYTLVESGVLLLQSNTAPAELTVDTENIIRGKIKNDSTDQFYIRKNNITSGDTWYARAYMLYKDTGGNIITLYSSNTVNRTMPNE